MCSFVISFIIIDHCTYLLTGIKYKQTHLDPQVAFPTLDTHVPLRILLTTHTPPTHQILSLIARPASSQTARVTWHKSGAAKYPAMKFGRSIESVAKMKPLRLFCSFLGNLL